MDAENHEVLIRYSTDWIRFDRIAMSSFYRPQKLTLQGSPGMNQVALI
ncbi:hypothetical protein J2X02_001550 [Pseudoxanthomonas japonensis]|nr:hypothetical protein [Pseudoxanthomonas japonensis]